MHKTHAQFQIWPQDLGRQFRHKKQSRTTALTASLAAEVLQSQEKGQLAPLLTRCRCLVVKQDHFVALQTRVIRQCFWGRNKHPFKQLVLPLVMHRVEELPARLKSAIRHSNSHVSGVVVQPLHTQPAQVADFSGVGFCCRVVCEKLAADNCCFQMHVMLLVAMCYCSTETSAYKRLLQTVTSVPTACDR